MKIPVSWLKDYVDVDASPAELAEKLTSSGTEIEAIETVGSGYEGIVVGEVKTVEPHPNADRLRVCRVWDGRQEVCVVCGATNFEVGDKAPLAMVGAVLADGTAIRTAKLRGVMSEGMLCAEDELGLSDDHAGIMVLPRDTVAGRPFADVVGTPDVVLTAEVTWNRPDCLSIIGMAREVAALFGTRLRLPSVDYPEGDEAVEALARVTIEDADGCPRYTARVLQDVKLGCSPMWMQRRLALCGVRPISNVVDITNYVMLECGQPLHAFDRSLLSGGEIIVRRAGQGEPFATLDGVARELDPEMLVIADAGKPVALAGIMGGEGSEIRDETTDVLLESAAFCAADIKRTGTRLALATESGHRFERGVDLLGVDWASRRAAALMVALGGATAARGVIDCFPRPPMEHVVTCRFDRCRRLLGVDLADEEIISILASLELAPADRTDKSCSVHVPSFRHDIEIEADLIEEVARMHGLDELPARAPGARAVSDISDVPSRGVLGCRAGLVGLGLSEIINYSFLSIPLLDVFRSDDAAERVVLPNPVSADYAVLRNTLVPQMVDCLGRNLARQTEEAALFEIGTVFWRGEEGGILEADRVSVGLMGPVGRTGLGGRQPVEPDEMFLWLKGVLEGFLESEHVEDLNFVAEDAPLFRPGWSVRVEAGGRRVGIMGLLSDSVRHRWRMAEPVGVAELDLGIVTARAFTLPVLKPVPSYPSVSRDMALVADESVTHETVLGVVRRSAPPELTAVRLFDIFRGKVVGEGKKSMAYSLVYRSHERTLTDEDANSYHESIKEALRDELGVDIRES